MDNLESKISKTFFSISEVAQIAELKPYVLRYWEKEFKEIKPQKNNVGVRRYSKEDIEIILNIKALLYEKQFTIKGAKAKLKSDTEKRFHMLDKEEESNNNPSNDELQKIKSKLESIIKLIDED